MNRAGLFIPRRAASAIELVLVVIILGLLAALAIPKLSRAGESTIESTLRERLMVLRTAIALYHRDHDVYPCGTTTDAGFPDDGCPANDDTADFEFGEAMQGCFIAQLTKITAKGGETSDSRTGPFAFGPYLKSGVPKSPLSINRDSTATILVVRGQTTPGHQPRFPQADWVFNCDTGDIAVNSDQVDSSGKRFDEY